MGNRGGDGPAGGGSGTVKDAKKASRKNELRTAVKNFKTPGMVIIDAIATGIKNNKIERDAD